MVNGSMMRILALASVLTVAGITGAAADCHSPKEVLNHLGGGVPATVAVVGDYEASSVPLLVAYVNSRPPATDYKPDEVILYIRSDKPPLRLVAFYANGCLIENAAVITTDDEIKMMIAAAKPYLGRPS